MPVLKFAQAFVYKIRMNLSTNRYLKIRGRKELLFDAMKLLFQENLYKSLL